MSKNKKRKRRNSNTKFNKVMREIESPLAVEVMNINNKIHEEEKEIYELTIKKKNITEDLVDRILLSNELKDLILNYIDTNKELEERKLHNENRKKDLEFKENKLSETGKTVVKEVTDYMTIDDTNDYYIGLFNSECKCPVAICKQKNVYLSYEDLEYKRCLKHKDHKICKHLEWLSLDNIY